MLGYRERGDLAGDLLEMRFACVGWGWCRADKRG